jgi:hypothetical protein
MRILAGQRRRGAGARPARLDSHPVTITIDDEHPGPVIPGDFAGLSFERGPLNPGNNAFASALWALDYLHWWAAHAAAGVNFHNKQWLYTGTIVPDPGPARAGYAVTPKGYGIKAFTLGSAGRVKPVQIGNPDDINLTAYCAGGAGGDYVTVINKTQGAGAADAAVTIVPPGPRLQGAEVMTLTGREPGDATGAGATLGGAAITGDAPWDGTWDVLPAGPGEGVSLTVRATTAAIARIRSGSR